MKGKRTAYMLFQMDKREEFKAQNPNLKGPEISKLLGKTWYGY